MIFKLNPSDHVHRVGFITNEQLEAISGPDTVAVYVPFSYTFTGETYLVEKKSVTHLDLPATEVMKFLVAGGVAEISSVASSDKT